MCVNVLLATRLAQQTSQDNPSERTALPLSKLSKPTASHLSSNTPVWSMSAGFVSQLYQEKISEEAKWTNIQYSESAAAATRAPLPFSARCLLLNWTLAVTDSREEMRKKLSGSDKTLVTAPSSPASSSSEGFWSQVFFLFFFPLQDFSPRSWAGFLAGRQLNICKFCLKRPWFQLINLQTRLFSSPADIISVLAELLAAVRVSQSRSLLFVLATPLFQTLYRAALCCVVRALTGSWRSRCPGAGRSRRSWKWRTAGGWRARPPRCRQTGFLRTAARASHLDGTQEERFSQSTFTQQCLFSGFHQLSLWQVK